MELIRYEAKIFVREVPFETPEEFKYWWCDEVDYAEGRILRPARMSRKEKDKYTVYETHNIATTNGRTQILTYLGQSAGTPILFSKWFAVGTGAITKVDPADTSLATELYRLQPTGTAITGTQQDVSILFTGSNGNGSWTNSGFYGNAASSTPGSGTLYTHALYSYTKTTGSVTNDYIYILQFV